MRSDGGNYNIEIIDYFDQGEIIRDNYRYLDFELITEIPEVRDVLISSLQLEKKDGKETDNIIRNHLSKEKSQNIFDIWLNAKGRHLMNRGISIKTEKEIFLEYMEERS